MRKKDKHIRFKENGISVAANVVMLERGLCPSLCSVSERKLRRGCEKNANISLHEHPLQMT